MIFKRAARTAGKKPPTSPMSNEKPRDVTMMDRERAKEKASSEKGPKFKVEIVKNWRSEASANPSSPPDSDNTNDSPKNAIIIECFGDKIQALPTCRSQPCDWQRRHTW